MDLDDCESKLNRRRATFYNSTANRGRATRLTLRAERYAQLEAAHLRRFDQVYVSNVADRDELRLTHRCSNIHTVPNGVRLPAISPLPAMKEAETVTLLIVGTLDYYPNEDAATWFCEDVLPRIRLGTRLTFRLLLVGSQPSDCVCKLDVLHPEVTVKSNVLQPDQCYNEATICLAPIRLGSGTRLKILEATSYARPVVATSMAAEGLDVEDCVNILIAHSASEFAQQCLTLMNNVSLGNRIAEQGLKWVSSRHLAKHTADEIKNLVVTNGRLPGHTICCNALDC